MKIIMFTFCLLIGFSILSVTAQNNQSDSTNQTPEIKSRPLYGGNIGIGYRILTGNISNHFSNPLCFPLSAEAHYNRFIISLIDDVGSGTAKRDIDLGDTTYWVSGMSIWHRTFSINFGIFPVNTKRIKVATMVGFMSNSMSTKYKYSKRNSRFEPRQYGIKISGFIDFKVYGKSKRDKADKFSDYCAIRLSMGAYFPLNSTVYPEYYNGNSLYFSIGFTELLGGKEKKERNNLLKEIRENLR